jgi:Tfp pilus assembly protein PilN
MYARLNLATKPLVSHRRFLLGAAALGALGGLLFISLGWRFYNLRKSDEEFRARTGKIQQEMDRLQEQRNSLEQFYARSENRDLQERAKFIDSVIDARSFNWTKMFMDLEHTLPSGVHVLKIDPRLENGSVAVKFVVGTSTPEAKLALLKAFEGSKSFSHTELISEDLPKPGGAPTTDLITIEFSAVYTGI